MPLKLMLTGLEFALDNCRLRVGRADHIDVSIHGDPLISSNHCIIDNCVLLDAASTNGTSINGSKIKHEHKVQLKHGDVITLGETALYVVEGAPYDGVGPTTPDGKPMEMSNKGGTGKQAKKKEATGGSKLPSSSARGKHKAGHEREGSSSASSAAQSAAPSPASSTTTMYRTAPTAPTSPANQLPNTASSAPSSVAPSSFNFVDQSRPLPHGSLLASTANAGTAPSGSQRSSRPASLNPRAADTDRHRLLDISHASLDDSMNAEGLLDLSAPPDRAHAEGQAGDVDDSAMELEEDSINISMDSAAARALDPAHRLSALNNSTNSSDVSLHPSAPPPPYQLPSPSSSSSASPHISSSSHSLDTTRLADDDSAAMDDSSQSQQVRKLQDALRESEVRAGRLERKLSHTQRRVSGAQVDATNRQAARVAELEGQVASLSYQLLYGAGPKDQEIQRLSEEVTLLRAEGDKHKGAGLDAQRNGGVKEERPTAEETAARAEKEKLALTAITEAASLLGTTRTQLMAAVAEYSTQMNALVSMQQTLAAQQQLLAEATRTAPKEQVPSTNSRDEAHQQLVSAVNGAAHSTTTALTAEKKAREERETELKRELAALTSQLAAVNQSIDALQDRVTTVKVEQQLEGQKAETAELRRRVGRGEEESKQKNGEVQPNAGDQTKLPLTPAATTLPAPSAAALQTDVAGLRGQVSSMSVQLQQVWAMVAALLAVTALLLLARLRG